MTTTKEAEPYERPECWRLGREQMLSGTPEDFARWRAEAAPIEERNAARQQARIEARREIERLIPLAWPPKTDGHKMVTKAVEKSPIERRPGFLTMLDDHEHDAIRRRTERAEKAALGAEQARKLLAAGAYLGARGKLVGVDYAAADAIEAANEIAREEAIAKQKAKGGFVCFGGGDECRGCAGWDMQSRHCVCGRRRVYWESDGDFEDMSVYAQAY